jgi:hypothetical protein
MRGEVKKMGKTHNSSFEQRIWIWCFSEDLVHPVWYAALELENDTRTVRKRVCGPLSRPLNEFNFSSSGIFGGTIGHFGEVLGLGR